MKTFVFKDEVDIDFTHIHISSVDMLCFEISPEQITLFVRHTQKSNYRDRELITKDISDNLPDSKNPLYVIVDSIIDESSLLHKNGNSDTYRILIDIDPSKEHFTTNHLTYYATYKHVEQLIKLEVGKQLSFQKLAKEHKHV